MNSVKLGRRSGRFKEVEGEMIKALRENGSVNVYPNTHRFLISELVGSLELEIRAKLGFEEIEFSTLKFNPFCNSFVMQPEFVGYKIFLK